MCICGYGLVCFDCLDGTAASLCSAKTSKSKCWNGKESLDNDGPEFSVDSIRGQGMSDLD